MPVRKLLTGIWVVFCTLLFVNFGLVCECFSVSPLGSFWIRKGILLWLISGLYILNFSVHRHPGSSRPRLIPHDIFLMICLGGGCVFDVFLIFGSNHSFNLWVLFPVIHLGLSVVFAIKTFHRSVFSP